jgi:Mn2+/Fe2+ NRAMP family transporter
MSQAAQYDPYALPADAIQDPPSSLWTALRKIGPGIILAGSIVGSGELIQTTRLGAEQGFSFLWLILFSCVIKVFVQIELGRYAISSGKPTLGALNDLPGPRLGAHWLVWWWFGMLLGTVFQLGAMAGLVGQALDLAFPAVSRWLAGTLTISLGSRTVELADGVVTSARYTLGDVIRAHPGHPWAVVTALAAIVLLLSGGYRRLERVTTALVVFVTALTAAGAAVLPFKGYTPTAEELWHGMTNFWPTAGIAVAFGAFGITGVGASELYSYPYWCLEKGYARFAGPNSPDDGWVRRARGWIRVMNMDAWVSMLVFTLATVSFYFMGATVLHQEHLKGNPLEKGREIPQLAAMYVPLLGSWAMTVFLVGAWAVLFKTLYVASAGHSRLTADFFSLAGFVRFTEPERRMRWIRGLCVFYPLLALVLYLFFADAKTMILIGGLAQGLTLPIISGATLYLRYRRTDKRLAPSVLSDVLLWFAVVSISVVAGYAVVKTIYDNLYPKPPDKKLEAPRDPAPVERGAAAGATAAPASAVSSAAPELESACRAVAAQLTERLGDECALIVHPPFVVAGDLSRADLEAWHRRTIRPAADALAASYFDTPPTRPISVLLFSAAEPYENYARRLFGDEGVSVYGYYKPGERTLVMNIATGGGTLVHELTHALIDFDFPEVPDWFNEGLASLHEQCRFRRDGRGIEGLVNWRLPALQEAIRRDRLRSLRSLVADGDFRGGREGTNYAQARYFCLYLQEQGLLADFYRRFRANQEDDPLGERSAAETFPDRTWAELDEDFRRWAVELDPP